MRLSAFILLENTRSVIFEVKVSFSPIFAYFSKEREDKLPKNNKNRCSELSKGLLFVSNLSPTEMV